VDRRDGGNLMTMEDLKEIAGVNKYVVDNVTATDGRHSFGYKDICGIYCNESNAIVIGFAQVMFN
jgi:hypothetical protein